MKKLLVLILFVTNSIFAQNIYFSTPTSSTVIYFNQSGSAGIQYEFTLGCAVIAEDDDYFAALYTPGEGWSNWQVGEQGGWWVTKAGTYYIKGKAYGKDCIFGTTQWFYRDPFSFQVVDNYAPAVPQSVSSSWQSSYPVITWSANTELDLDSYEIQKRVVGETGWASVATVTAETTQWTDPNAQPSGKFDPSYTIEYKVKANDINNNSSDYSPITSVTGNSVLWKKNSDLEASSITDYKLFSNYPNPFNPSTSIAYQIASDGFVSLMVYNSLGETVATLVNEFQSKASYSVEFDASNLPSGIYFYKIQTGNFVNVKKMILAK